MAISARCTRSLRYLLGAFLAALAASPSTAAEAFDHSSWDALLRRQVVDGMVDYDAFQRSPELPRYLEALFRFDPAVLPPAERLAYWINAYNAYTIHLVNEHRERDSIRNIKRPWKEPIVRAGGKVYSLDDVEHKIIRRGFREPRIHFALVCAAMSCPPLRSEAYTGARLDTQLDDQARIFLVRSEEKNRVDVPSRTVYLSRIFDYYKEDFGTTDAAIGRYVARFHPEGPQRDLLLGGVFALKYTEYDWTLNSQEKARLLAQRKRTSRR